MTSPDISTMALTIRRHYVPIMGFPLKFSRETNSSLSEAQVVELCSLLNSRFDPQVITPPLDSVLQLDKLLSQLELHLEEDQHQLLPFPSRRPAPRRPRH